MNPAGRAPLLIVLAGIVAALHVGKVPPALPLLREPFGLSLTAAGFLLSAVQVAGMSCGIVAGIFIEAIGLRRGVLLGLLLLAAASLAGAYAASAGLLLTLRALEGAGFLLVVLPAPGLIKRLGSTSQLPTLLGLWGTYMPVGMAVSLLGGALTMERLGWAAWWQCLAALSLAMALAVKLGVPADAAGAANATKAPSASTRLAATQRRLALTLAQPPVWRWAEKWL